MNIIKNEKGQFVKGQKTRKHYPVLNKKYGKFTVISEEIKLTLDSKIQFKVKCDCGKEQYVRAYFLESGRQTCCKQCRSKINYNNAILNGSKVGFIKLNHEGIGNFTKTAYYHFKRNAKVRNIIWSEELTIEYLFNLFLKQNKKCALSNLNIDFTEIRKSSNVNFEFMTASLDRINSNLGYVPNNVQWVHKDVNRMKWAFNQEHFINLCKLISNHANQQGS